MSIVPRTQQKYTQGKTGQQHNRKKHGKTKSSELETQVVQLQERLQNEQFVKKIYVDHNQDLTKELAKEKSILEKTESKRQEVLLRYESLNGLIV